jgi:hypothetical protein
VFSKFFFIRIYVQDILRVHFVGDPVVDCLEGFRWHSILSVEACNIFLINKVLSPLRPAECAVDFLPRLHSRLVFPSTIFSVPFNVTSDAPLHVLPHAHVMTS